MPEHNFTFERYYKIAAGIGLAMFAVGLIFYSIILNWKIDCEHPERPITIERGSSATAVAQLLKQESCLKNTGIFKLALSMTMKNRSIRPGRYNLKGISSMGQLVKVISSQSTDRVKITLVEGWTVEQYAAELKEKLQIDSFEFMRLNQDYDFIHALNIDAPSLEGFLFPDTYILLKTYTEEEIIEILVNQFTHNKRNLLKEHRPVQPLNMWEITTLASIIQGEAIHDDEMPIISSVYHNRLNNNMLLQADPTIQYIIPGPNRRLFNKDYLRYRDNPYNTYSHKGLPPGPINSPGFHAIKAAAYPVNTSFLFFVAKGNNQHYFTENERDHINAKNKYLKDLWDKP